VGFHESNSRMIYARNLRVIKDSCVLASLCTFEPILLINLCALERFLYRLDVGLTMAIFNLTLSLRVLTHDLFFHHFKFFLSVFSLIEKHPMDVIG
jgi:hypothetical protein